MNLPTDTQIKVNREGIVRGIRGNIPITPAVGDSGRTADDIAAIVKSALEDLGDDLQIAASGQGKLEITHVREVNGRVYVRLKETLDGLPVCGSDIVTEVSEDNQIKRVGITRYQNRVTSGTVVGDAGKAISKKQAIAAVTKLLDDDSEILVRDAVKAYYPADHGMYLCWEVTITTATADWQYRIDAHSKEIYSSINLRVHIDGNGMVFDPNPVVTSNDNTLRDNSAAATLNAERVSRVLKDITQDGSNFRLEGPWVRIENRQNPAIDPPELTTSTFNFTRDQDEFEAVNIYYHVDTLQRYIQNELGITNVMNWSIPCDHHTGANGGAFYSPSGLFMGFGGSGPTRPDRGEDGDVMAHEYGHAIQHDMVPGWGVFNTSMNRQEARAMGEGFGDALACIYYQEGGGLFQQEVFEDWIFGDVGGLRRVDGTKQYPGESTTGTTGDWVNQVHSDGEIWSATLWSAYLEAGGNSASAVTRATTRKEFLRSLILHHFSLNTDATFPEAAEALLEQNAEDPETQGRQIIPLLNSFHDRNILRINNNVDLWIKDKPSHTGSESVTNPFWNSPDVWIRNTDDNGTTHQAPEFGQDNWFYARVRNRGTQTCRAFAVTFNVKIFQGTQFVYPGDFVPAMATAVGFNLPPGGEQIVKARWPSADVPAAGSHGCLLVSAYAATDEAVSGRHVWEDNNLAQKNLTIVDLLPNDTADVTFRVGNLLIRRPELFRLEVLRPAGLEKLELGIVHPNREIANLLQKSIREVAVKDPGHLVSGINIRNRVTLAENLSHATLNRSTVLTALEGARFRIGDIGMLDDDNNSSLELHLAPGSEILRLESQNTQNTADFESQDNEPLDADFAFSDVDVIEDENGRTELRFQPGRIAGFPLRINPKLHIPLKLRVKAPRNAKRGETHEVHLQQRDRKGRVVGGVTVQINIV